MNSRLAVIELRVERLESEMKAIHALSGQISGIQSTMEGMVKTLAAQDVRISDLTNLAAGGKGAFWMFMTIGGGVIAVTAWVLSIWGRS